MVFPAFSGRCARICPALSAAPEEMPTRIPSVTANLRLSSKASSFQFCLLSGKGRLLRLRQCISKQSYSMSAVAESLPGKVNFPGRLLARRCNKKEQFLRCPL